MAKTTVTTGTATINNVEMTNMPQVTIKNVEAVAVTDTSAVVAITEQLKLPLEMLEITTRTEGTETTDSTITWEEMATETTAVNGEETQP